jgi:Sigma-70, region 4
MALEAFRVESLPVVCCLGNALLSQMLSYQKLASETAHPPQEAILALPPKFRFVVILRYSSQMSFVEIGQVLSLPETTAKTYFHRAKVLLRKTLLARLQMSELRRPNSWTPIRLISSLRSREASSGSSRRASDPAMEERTSLSTCITLFITLHKYH